MFSYEKKLIAILLATSVLTVATIQQVQATDSGCFPMRKN